MLAALRIYQKLKKSVAAWGFVVRSGPRSVYADDATVTAGVAAPSEAEPAGSLYLRTDGGLYTRIAAAWRPVVALAYASVAPSTAITGVTEAETNFDTVLTLPANALRVGSVVRIRAQGIHTATTGAETHTIALKLGTLSLAAIATLDPANNDIFYFDFEFVVRTVGASGTIVGCGLATAGASGTVSAKTAALPSTVVDTTGALVVAAAIDRQASATDSDSARLEYITVTVVG